MNALNVQTSAPNQLQLLAPGQLFAPRQAPGLPVLPPPRFTPPASPQPKLSQVSTLLARPDQVQLSSHAQTQPRIHLQPLFANNKLPVVNPLSSRPSLAPLNRVAVSTSPRMQQLQAVITESGLKEWRSGVRETQGSNKGPRINEYARNAKFGPGYEWCGFFTAFNYSQAGFKYPESFASYQKSRDFFLYRSYTSRDSGLHQRLDNLRDQHKAEGSSRQYFIMPGSPTEQYVKNYSRFYGHVDLPAMTYDWRSLPIQPGDVALFSHGHVAQVISYDPSSGKLETVEGNTSGQGPDGKQWSQAVVRKSYDLSKAADRQRFDGFGRAALDDFA